MNTIDEKRKVWEKPEIVDLDLKKTNSGSAESSEETAYVFPAYS